MDETVDSPTRDGPVPTPADGATSDGPGGGSTPPVSPIAPGGSSGSGAAPSTPSVALSVRGYQVKGKLGEGGMGTVWLARQVATHRDVALKVMSAGLFGSERARLRFEREVELTARLEHPNIARVYDSGFDGGLCYYAMELIEGASLLDAYAAAAKLPEQQVVALFVTVCRAVEHAHQKGVIHRDLKPANILIDSTGAPRVLDFGLAKGLAGSRGRLRRRDGDIMEGDVSGTPAYMSPEQAAGRSREVDTRSDVYTLGVILFRLLTGGTFPHDTSGTFIEVLRRVAEDEPLRLTAVAPGPTASWTRCCPRRWPASRPAGMAPPAALAADLARYLAGEPLVARPPTLSYVLGKKLRRYRGRLSAAAAVLLLLVGTAVWAYVRVTKDATRLWWRGRRRITTPSSPPTGKGRPGRARQGPWRVRTKPSRAKPRR